MSIEEITSNKKKKDIGGGRFSRWQQRQPSTIAAAAAAADASTRCCCCCWQFPHHRARHSPRILHAQRPFGRPAADGRCGTQSPSTQPQIRPCYMRQPSEGAAAGCKE